MRHRREELERAFFSTRFSRVLDPFGYATLMRWRLYGEEGLAGREAALWLHEKALTVEHEGEPLSRYEVEVEAVTEKLRTVTRARLFETFRGLPQVRLFSLSCLSETGWLRALRPEDYAPRRSRCPEALQRVPFPYHQA